MPSRKRNEKENDVACYTLQKSLVARCKICSLLVSEVVHCKNNSLLVAKFARYSLQKLHVAIFTWLLVAKFARYLLQKQLLAANNHSLLVAKFAHYSLQKLLVAKYPSLQALCTLFHIEGAKFFKKRQFQGRLKQLNLEQNPG